MHYKAHINIEVYASVQAVKYIHKYIYKGNDRTTLWLQSNDDEISQYLQGCYIGPTEAIWWLFEFPMHEETPLVTHLAIHLLDKQPIYFNTDASEEEVRNYMANACSTLMAFFRYNTNHVDGQSYLYQEFPAHYIFDMKK